VNTAGENENRTYTGDVTRPVQEGPDPRDFLHLLWRRKWILILCVVLIPLATYVVSNRLSKTYEATTLVQLQTAAIDTPGPVTGELGATPTDVAPSIAAVIPTSGVADEAARILHMPKGSLRGAATAKSDEDTGFIKITGSASTAERSAQIANAFAAAVRATREKQSINKVDQGIRSAESDLAALRPGDVVGRQEAQQRLARLRTLRGAQSQNLQVIEPASPPGSFASPKPKRNAVLALVAALLIGAGLVSLAERLDRRIREPKQLEELTGAPLLARIPPTAFPGAVPDPQVPIVFQALRDSLTYFNVDRTLTSLAVISPLKGEGKTTVATHLAVSFARAGKRVILVDADLRSPQAGARMGFDRAPGLSDVLMGADPEDSLREVEGMDSHLLVLPGGTATPNPSEMLGSVRMSSVLARLSEMCDLLIIDTAPVLVVSDAFPLLGQVSGIVALARLEQTPRDAVRRMVEVALTASGRVLGMVATGGQLREDYAGGYGYGYGYGYGEPVPVPEHTSPLTPGGTNGSGPGQPVAAGPAGWVRRVFRSG
jgi:polysaccharide biosynthesis transport protein